MLIKKKQKNKSGIQYKGKNCCEIRESRRIFAFALKRDSFRKKKTKKEKKTRDILRRTRIKYTRLPK